MLVFVNFDFFYDVSKILFNVGFFDRCVVLFIIVFILILEYGRCFFYYFYELLVYLFNEFDFFVKYELLL